MWVFYILLLLPMALKFLEMPGYKTDGQKRSKSTLGLFFLMLTVLIALRHETVGKDTKNYLNFFEMYSTWDWNEFTDATLEIGYLYFNKAVSYISEDPRVFLAIATIVVSALIYPTYRRLNVDTSLTIALFCTMSTFVMMFSGIRQMLAIAIGFIAYEFTRTKKPIFFVLAVALAMTIHVSAFILVLMYPVYHLKINRTSLSLMIPLFGLLLILNEPIFTFLGTYIEKYTRFEAEISETGAYTMIILFVIFVAFSFIIPDEKTLDKETSGLRNILLLCLALQMFAPIHTLAMRMNYYFIIFIPLLIMNMHFLFQSQYHQMHFLVAFVPSKLYFAPLKLGFVVEYLIFLLKIRQFFLK